MTASGSGVATFTHSYPVQVLGTPTDLPSLYVPTEQNLFFKVDITNWEVAEEKFYVIGTMQPRGSFKHWLDEQVGVYGTNIYALWNFSVRVRDAGGPVSINGHGTDFVSSLTRN